MQAGQRPGPAEPPAAQQLPPQLGPQLVRLVRHLLVHQLQSHAARLQRLLQRHPLLLLLLLVLGTLLWQLEPARLPPVSLLRVPAHPFRWLPQVRLDRCCCRPRQSDATS